MRIRSAFSCGGEEGAHDGAEGEGGRRGGLGWNGDGVPVVVMGCTALLVRRILNTKIKIKKYVYYIYSVEYRATLLPHHFFRLVVLVI